MKRLLIVQFSGDYRAVHPHGLSPDRFFGQDQKLDALGHLAQHHGEAGILCCTASPHTLRLPSGITVMGGGVRSRRHMAPILKMVAEYDPSHLVVTDPMPRLIHWGLRTGRDVGCIFADSFPSASPLRRLHLGQLTALLNDRGVSLVANHGVNAARKLVDLGVSPDKVLAWDFPQRRTPDLLAPRYKPRTGPYKLLYLGAISEQKGVGDLIRALARLKDRLDLRLDIAGAGQVDRMKALVIALGLFQKVRFLGSVADHVIPALMEAADAVVVPSRHSSPEALPFVLYEGLLARTPIILSDHPMFVGNFVHGETALVFKAGAPRALAEAMISLFGDDLLYARVSRNSPECWARMQVPLKWGPMLDRWMGGGPEGRARLSWQSLGAQASRMEQAVLDAPRPNDKREA